MQKRYVALLRAISNVSMKPFREGMEVMRLANVESYGMSGNLLFSASAADAATLERRISERFGTPAMVRSKADLSRIVSQDPFDSAVLFLTRTPTAARRQAFLELEFKSPRPLLRGRTVYYVHPAQPVGKRTPFDFEGALGVLGTARSSRVVRALLERM
jgi:uncharacterized protein (DUF1697 family)